MRYEVVAFAEEMEKRFVLNDHKGEWKNSVLGRLLSKMSSHKLQLQTNAFALQARQACAYGNENDENDLLERILDDAADVANYAMMIADICGALPEKQQPPVAEPGVTKR